MLAHNTIPRAEEVLKLLTDHPFVEIVQIPLGVTFSSNEDDIQADEYFYTLHIKLREVQPNTVEVVWNTNQEFTYDYLMKLFTCLDDALIWTVKFLVDSDYEDKLSNLYAVMDDLKEEMDGDEYCWDINIRLLAHHNQNQSQKNDDDDNNATSADEYDADESSTDDNTPEQISSATTTPPKSHLDRFFRRVRYDAQDRLIEKLKAEKLSQNSNAEGSTNSMSTKSAPTTTLDHDVKAELIERPKSTPV